MRLPWILLHLVFRFLVWAFFWRVHVHNLSVIFAEQLNRGPLCVVSTHFNALLDAPFCGLPFAIRRRFAFVSGSFLFKNRLVSIFFLRIFHMIKVYRREDRERYPDEAEHAWRHIITELQGGAVCNWFPAKSHGRPGVLEEFRWGVAQSALQAVQERPDLDVRILCMGRNRSTSILGGSVTINISPNIISVRPYLDSHGGNLDEAATQLTADLQRRVTEVTALAPSEEKPEVREAFLSCMPFYRLAEDDFTRLRELRHCLEHLRVGRVHSFSRFCEQVRSKRDFMQRVDESGYPFLFPDQSSLARWFCVPFVAAGWLFHYLPGSLARYLAERLVGAGTYYFSSAMLGISVICFPIWYSCLFLLGLMLGKALFTGAFLVALALCARFALVRYWQTRVLLASLISWRSSELLEFAQWVEELPHLVRGRSVPQGEAVASEVHWEGTEAAM